MKLIHIFVLVLTAICQKLFIITLSLFSFRLTITDVICWSKKIKMEARIAGITDARMIHQGFLWLMGLMIQPRSGLVGWSFVRQNTTAILYSLYSWLIMLCKQWLTSCLQILLTLNSAGTVSFGVGIPSNISKNTIKMIAMRTPKSPTVFLT